MTRRPDLLADNPLSKVPCLVTDDGLALFDSPVICEYLDSLGDALPMFPEHGAARWRALKFQAMGDGILDAAVPCRWEMLKPEEAGRDRLDRAAEAAVDRTLDALEADPPHGIVDIGSIAVACALGYLDFRFAARAVAAGASEAGRVVRGVRREPRDRPDRAAGLEHFHPDRKSRCNRCVRSPREAGTQAAWVPAYAGMTHLQRLFRSGWKRSRPRE